jgi:hypothetical protein
MPDSADMQYVCILHCKYQLYGSIDITRRCSHIPSPQGIGYISLCC